MSPLLEVVAHFLPPEQQDRWHPHLSSHLRTTQGIASPVDFHAYAQLLCTSYFITITIGAFPA